jgi:hypothetical protein
VRRFIASVAAAAMLSVPMMAMPPTAAAQQLGLVNISILDDSNVEVLSRNNVNVTAAVNAIVQACDLIDVGEANVLVVQALARDGTAVISDCDNVGDQNLTLTESQTQRGGGRGNRNR